MKRLLIAALGLTLALSSPVKNVRAAAAPTGRTTVKCAKVKKCAKITACTAALAAIPIILAGCMIGEHIHNFDTEVKSVKYFCSEDVRNRCTHKLPHVILDGTEEPACISTEFWCTDALKRLDEAEETASSAVASYSSFFGDDVLALRIKPLKDTAALLRTREHDYQKRVKSGVVAARRLEHREQSQKNGTSFYR